MLQVTGGMDTNPQMAGLPCVDGVARSRCKWGQKEAGRMPNLWPAWFDSESELTGLTGFLRIRVWQKRQQIYLLLPRIS